jgi:hypothetical protein
MKMKKGSGIHYTDVPNHPPRTHTRYILESDETPSRLAGYDLRRGAYLTDNFNFAYTWKTSAEAEAQLPLYQRALPTVQLKVTTVTLSDRYTLLRDI